MPTSSELFIKVGQAAPEFTLPGSDGQNHSLADYSGQWVILYFYPKDDTSGCTKEACSFRDNIADFGGVNGVVLGVSVDSLPSHEKFIKKFNLPFVLLSDEQKQVVAQYGVWQEKSMYGKKYMGTVRFTFLINPQGKIAHIFEKVDVAKHADEVLAVIKAEK